MEEVFKAIEGYDGLYEVSNLGRVRSLKWGKERILSPGMAKKGYLLVKLYKEGKGKWFQVHRLVGMAFIPNPEGLPVINHKDENPKNNVVFLKDDGSVDQCRSNLEWCTYEYNNNYGTRTERAVKNIVQTRINNGTADPELCGIGDEKEYHRMYRQKNNEKIRERNLEYYQKNQDRIQEYQRKYYQKNKERILEHRREYDRQRRLRKKQKNKKDNHPSEESLW